MKITVPQNLIELANACNTAGEHLFVVGGYVRNALLKLPTHDIDICSALPVDTVKHLAQQLGWKAVVINQKLGTVKIVTGAEVFEHTTFRADNYPEGGNHMPTDVEFVGDIATDALRRDFTINALYYNILTGEVLDFFGGLTHLAKGSINTIHPAVFESDGLRLVRLIRFSIMLGFKINGRTWRQALKNRHHLNDISKERVREEFYKLLEGDVAASAENQRYFCKLVNNLEVFKSMAPKLTNFKIKGFLLFELAAEHRYMAFALSVLASYFSYKPTTHHQVIFACHKIFGSAGLKESTKKIVEIYSAYNVYQVTFNTRPQITPSVLCDFYNLESHLQQLLAAIAPKFSDQLASAVEEYKDSNIPLSKRQLDVSNVELLTKANIQSKYISKVMDALFNLALNQKVANQKAELLAAAIEIASQMPST